ncbi:PAS domain S-box protein [Methanolobus vulcani]|uniref:histidine kinase n=1 Tax=Methanolobus vulcani TaxID=38026 RepID=A0A7Z8KP22_9EURY|nr:PAS domain S-box protein [Methanolobus vulcani]TQD25100.1 PAS domain S-box protein [Methanolobus vulcani]
MHNLFETIFNSINDSIIVYDYNGRILEVNQAICDSLGYSRDEFLQMTVYDIILPEFREDMSKQIAEKLHQKNCLVEGICKRKDGSLLPIELNVTPSTLHGNEIKIAIVRDITERKHADENLRESEALLSKVGQIAKIGGWQFETASNKLILTPEILQIYEADETHSTPKEALEYYTAGSKEILQKAFYNALENRKSYDLELEIITEKGNHKWVRASGYPEVVNEKFVKITGTLQDITERKNAENKSFESEKTLRMFIEHVPATLIVLDSDMRHIAVSRRWADTVSLSVEDIIGKYHYNVIPDIPEHYKDAHSRALQGEVVRRDYDPVEMPDGSTHWHCWEVVPWKTADGTIGGIIIFSEDVTERKEAEIALQESEALLNEVEVITKIAGWELEPITYKSKLTPEMNVIFELDSDTTLDSEIALKCFHPSESRETLEKAVYKLIEESEPFDLELEMVTEKGNHKWVRSIGKPIIEGNEIIKFTGILQDITERKNAEEALIESEERYKALHNASFDGITIHDKGMILDCNLGLSEITGYSFDELIGIDGLLLIAEGSRELVRGNILAGYEEPYEAVGRRKDGTEYPIRLEARSIPYKGKMVRAVEFRDITEQKESEKALRESESKFRTYVQSAPYAIFIMDEHGNYLEVNKTTCTITGYDENELTQMNISDLIAPESLLRVGQSLDELTTKGYTSIELQIVRKDGSVRWVRGDGAKLSDNRFILFVSDITEKKKAEHSLVEAKILAEHSNRIKSEFLANMSHELRTPLTSVIGFSDILREGVAGELTEKQFGYVDNINKGGKHLLEIINDILNLSKTEAGKMELECRDFHVSKVIDETLESMYPIADKKNIELKLINNVNDLNIHADKVKFQQILYNLVSNAIKFTPENGEVLVIVERTDNGIQVFVTDSGIGIAAEMQEEIFSPFTQVDASHTRRYGGTGLGLALVKKFVEMHNGNVWFVSEVGKGSTFTFTIPTAPSA